MASESLIAAVRWAPTEEPVAALLAAPHVAADKDRPGSAGVNALGLAVWRNHAGLVEALLEAGADPDAPDGESGWAPLHRALHWGQLRCAAALLRANASLTALDWRGRTPLDLLSAELKEYVEPGGDGDVFAWGNGNNYTLGTGSTDVQLHPARVESLHDLQVVAISAAKFHSAAVTVDGRLLTWGWGRGGRLGHPESHIHSGEGAVISPLAVAALGRRQVAVVAAGKHHTLLCTTAGEVFTCGSNRHGQLGYAVDSQPTPRRVSSLRHRVVAVAAANKHSVAVTASGDVYTWGCNVLGQLGYGTSDSSSNAAPRLVEAMRGKPVVAAAAAKRHTLVLTASGEVYTWGHRGVSPRRVQLAGARDAASLDGAPICFHRGHADVARPVAAAITAGAAHSSALTGSGVVLCWRSADPALQVQEVGGALAGKRVVAIAAGKYRTAALSDEGDAFMWEGRSDYFPAEGRQPGSGSKKPPLGSASKASKSRPIPLGECSPLGAEGLLAGSYGAAGSADVAGGTYGSHTRRPGSWIERFAWEREASATSGVAFGSPGSYGAAARFDAGFGATPGSGGKSRASDTFEKIRPERVEGLKRAAAVAVGEKHSLAVQRWSAAQLEGMAQVPWLQGAAAASRPASAAAEAAEEDAWFTRAADGLLEGGSLVSPREGSEGGEATPAASPAPVRPSPVRPGPRRDRLGGGGVGAPSLQAICEEEVARRLVDPRTCLQVLEYADVAGADMLRAYCLSVAVCNLDAVLLEAGGAFEELAPHLLAELERLYKLHLAGAGGSSGSGAAEGGDGGVSRALDVALHAAEPAGPEAAAEGSGGSAGPAARRAGSRLQPGRRPTAAAPWLGDEGLEGFEGLAPGVSLPPTLSSGGSSFVDRSQADAAAAAQRLQRTLQKKLQQIEHLAEKAAAGGALDVQQRAKLEQQPVLVSALAALEGGMAPDDVQSILRAASASRAVEAEAGSAPGSSAAAPGSAAKQQKGKPKSGVAKAAAPSSSSAATAAPVAVLEATDSSSLLGSSPPASSLVPAFGFVGSPALAAGLPPPAFSPATSPPAQMRSQVGFAAAGSDGVAVAAAAQQGQVPPLARPGSSKPRSAAKRKGGLSMFLRGELEQAAPAGPAEAGRGGASGSAPPAPAWGARPAAPAEGAASLKAILDQETAGSASKPPAAALRTTPGSGIKSRPALDSPGPAGSGGGPLRLSLASFMQSSPVAVQRGQQQQQRDGASPPPPAWGGATVATGAAGPTGASPRSRHTSFRAIQQEQQAAAPPRPALGTSPPAVQRLGGGLPPWRPPVPPSQPAGPSLLGTSPSASISLLGSSPSGRSFVSAPQPQHSKWYIPEESRVDTSKSLLDIQTEEVVMAELAKQYGDGSVCLVGTAEHHARGRGSGGDGGNDDDDSNAGAGKAAGERRASGGRAGGDGGSAGAGKAERRPGSGRGGAAGAAAAGVAAAAATAAAGGEGTAGDGSASTSGGKARLPRPAKQQQHQRQKQQQQQRAEERGQPQEQAPPRRRQRHPQRSGAAPAGSADGPAEQQECRPKQLERKPQQQRRHQQRAPEQQGQAQQHALSQDPHQKQQRPRGQQQRQRRRPEQHQKQQQQQQQQQPLAQQEKPPPPPLAPHQEQQ